MTEAEFGIRIPIHRLRDNAATEASETLEGGGRAASALLGHRSLAVTRRHYDHLEGFQTAQEFGELLDPRCRLTVELDL